MADRKSIPRNVERALWGESCGYCMNPDCGEALIDIKANTNIGELAHIEPVSSGGNNSDINLILLCRNCHKLNEPVDNPEAKSKLNKWKEISRDRINSQFLRSFMTFNNLKDAVVPLLEENASLFYNYGPVSGSIENAPARYRIWKLLENKLVANNSKLALLLKQNTKLFHSENQDVVKLFLTHCDEFEVTRNETHPVRKVLFPTGLLSMFEIEEEPTTPAVSVNALQNFIGHLQSQGRFQSLELVGVPAVYFKTNDDIDSLLLINRHYVQQFYFNNRLFCPNRTALRLDNLIWFLKKLNSNSVRCEFDNHADLTVLTVAGSVRFKLVYSYLVSLDELQSQDLSGIYAVVNLHNWNGGPFNEQAHEYAETHGVQLMSTTEMIGYCAANLKS